MAQSKSKSKPTPKPTAAKQTKQLVAEKLVVYKDAFGEWRWHTVASNGKVLSESSEGYTSRNYALRMARELNPDLPAEWGPGL